MKVIGAGFGKTGTMSLKAALEELGFGPCYHMTEVFEHPQHADCWEAAWRGEAADWDGVLGGYESTVDWPACTFYAELMEKRHPDAKVLLSVRDPERWYESTRNTIYEISKISTGSPFSRLGFALLSRLVFGRFNTRQGPMGDEIIFQGTFDGKFEDKHHAIEVFDRHNEEVRRRVPKERLLVYEVKEGWGPLCEFLGVEEPDKPFPHLNEAAEMRRMILVLRILSVAIPTALALVVCIPALALLRRGQPVEKLPITASGPRFGSKNARFGPPRPDPEPLKSVHAARTRRGRVFQQAGVLSEVREAGTLQAPPLIHPSARNFDSRKPHSSRPMREPLGRSHGGRKGQRGGRGGSGGWG